jgi:hypothetical protein
MRRLLAALTIAVGLAGCGVTTASYPPPKPTTTTVKPTPTTIHPTTTTLCPCRLKHKA